ncbi:arsenate reductase ArsC [Sphingosinicella terrae]|uniref:arsenate reductase ArsC n=1 Tax=Sphingosinicella terrae TaxID=2172047 RepID=UPI000E0D3062|nr:arsenate reductase ArsC [Sphingosinicella terrae]
MTDRIYNVLFLCTGNSARSILAEALLNRMGEGRFRAWSAGSFPKGEVHPEALRLLSRLGFDTTDLASKSWDAFAEPDAPEFHFIFTVCDDAAGETCPIWPGHPMAAHWGIEDPARAVPGDQPEAFQLAFNYLRRRISLFLALPIESLDRMTMRRRLVDIGARSEGGSAVAAAATDEF